MRSKTTKRILNETPQKVKDKVKDYTDKLVLCGVIKSVCGWCGEKRILNENKSCKCCACLDNEQAVL